MILDETNTLANAIYIYLVILFTGILAGSILVLLKEYIKQVPPDIEKASDLSGNLEVKQSSLSSADISEKSHSSSNPRLKTEHSAKSYLKRFKNKRSNSGDPVNSPKFEDKSSSSSTGDKSQSENEIQSLGLEAKKPTRYSMQELLELQGQSTQLQDITQKVKLSVLLGMQVPLPPAIILSESVMKTALHEIQNQVTDSYEVSCQIAFLRLVHIASFKVPFSNSCHFREEFCELMVYLIDSLTIYSSALTQPLLQLSLVDIASCFAWEHWNSKWCAMVSPVTKPSAEQPGSSEYSDSVPDHSHINSTDYINDSYEHNFTGLATGILQNTESTTVLPDVAVFRLLCNLYLGSPAIAKSVRAQCVYKLSAIFHACATRTQCGQHRELIALLAQAVASAQRDSLKAFFYELLIDLLQPHIFCCLENEDLSAGESPIYELIFKGLWTDQAPRVREKASKAVLLLSERFSDVKSWIKYMKQTNADSGLGRVGAPGSWSEYNCE